MSTPDPRGAPVLTHEALPLTPREREIVATAATLSAGRFWPRAAAVDRESRFPADDFADLRQAGLLGLLIPEAYGGLGVSDLAYAAVVLEIAKGNGSTALCFTMHCTAMSYLRHLGSDDQRRRFYRRVLEEGALVSALGSEPRANIFSAELPRTRLEPVPGGYLLRGKKIWCSLGPNAQVAFVNCTLDGRIVGALVDLSADNVRIGTDWDSLAMRGTQSVDISFDEVFVPSADVVPEPLNLLLELEFGIGLASAYLGVAESAYRVARMAATARVGRLLEHPIGHGHPDVGRMFTSVGEMRIGLVPAWLMVQRAASIPEVGTLARTWALAEAKHVVAETGAKIAQEALRVVGATALMRQHSPFERLFRDLHAGLVMAIKPDNAAYLAGRFELGVLPEGMAELLAPPPPRVLLLTPQFPTPELPAVGGLYTHCAELVAGLRAMGCQVTVLTPRYDGPTAVQGEVHRVRPSDAVLALPPSPAGLPGRLQLEAFGDELASYAAALPGRYDVVHAHDLWLGPAAEKLGARLGLPVVLTAHLLHAPIRAWWGMPLDPELAETERRALHAADAVITVSRSMAEIVRSAHDLAAERVRPVINGFDPAPFASGQAERRPRVVFAGRLDRQKGLPALLEAMARVVHSRPEVELVLAGLDLEAETQDPHEVALIAEIRNLLGHFRALAERTVLPGHLSRERLAELYATAAVAVVPSVYEPCGYAAMEAMAAGLPVVASDAGGLAEVVVHGETGLLVPVDRRSLPHAVEVAPLAEAIAMLLDEPARAAAMGAAGLQRARACFSREAMAAATREVYAAVLGEGR